MPVPRLVLITPEDSLSSTVVASAMEKLPELVVHVRNLKLADKDLQPLICEIPTEFRARLVLHHRRELAMDLGINWHYSDMHQAGSEVGAVSRSVHTEQEFLAQEAIYNYLFCSPVFDSISKEGYRAGDWNISNLPVESRRKAVALGGINVESIPRARELGFDNFAVLGAVWKSVDPVRSCVELYNSIYQDEI